MHVRGHIYILSVLLILFWASPIDSRLEIEEDGGGGGGDLSNVLSGQVLDVATDAPLPNVTLTIVGTTLTTKTTSLGKFTISGPPLGSQTLLLDARTTTTPGSWPFFPIPVTIVEGTNTFPTPIWLPELDEKHGTALTASNFDSLTGKVLQTITVTSPTAVGVKITIPQNTYMQNVWDPLGLGDVLSVTSIPSTKPPQPLPNDAVVGMLVITQPGGILFFSDAAMATATKIPMEFPNIQNEYTDGSKVNLYSALGGQFGTLTNGGSMTVQGEMILPDSGTGISHFSCKWTPPSPPTGSTNTSDNPQDIVEPSKACPLPIGSDVNPMDGNLTVEHPLAAHRALGTIQPLQLVYTSSSAYPHPIITSQTSLPTGAPIPLATSAALGVSGVPQGNPVFWQATDQLARQAVTFDAASFATGRYPYTLTLTNNYPVSNLSTTLSDKILVRNDITSPFGAGWGIDGLQRLSLELDGSAVVSEGGGSASVFASGTSDLVSHWSAEGDATDSIADNHGTIQNGATFTQGKIGQAFSFDGVDDVIDVTDNAAFTLGVKDFTVDLWVNFNQINGRDPFIGHDDGGGSLNKWIFWSDDQGHGPQFQGQRALRFHINGPGIGPIDPISTPWNPVIGQWVHVAVTRNETTYILYINGIPAATATNSLTIPDPVVPLTIGRAEGYFLNGLVDEVEIYDRALSASEIQTIFTTGSIGTTEDLRTPTGDFSILIKNPDATFTRTLKDGTRIEFDQNGFHTRTVDRNGNATTYSYNADGTLASIIDPAGFMSTLTYSAGKLSSINDSAERTTRFKVDSNGNLVEVIDPDGAKTTFTYDSSQVSGSDHLMTARTPPRAYDPSEPIFSPQFVTSYTYNFAGQLIQTDRFDSDGSLITWKLLPSQANALVDPASGLGTSKENPAPLVLVQDVASQLTGPSGKLTKISTDPFGAATKITDPIGRVTTIQRDGFGGPTKIIQPNAAVTTMTYDLKGNLLTLNEEGTNGPGSDDLITTFTYEPTYNQVATILDPNQNKNASGVTTKIDYDAFGNPIQITDANDTITELKYDESGKGHSTIKGLLTSIIAAKGLSEEVTTNFTYEPTFANLKTTTDPLGRITSLTYDAVGNVQTSSAEGNDNNSATDQTTTFSYDLMNRLLTVTDADNQTTAYDYDAHGNLIMVTDAKTPAGITQFAYDEFDRLSQTTDPLGHLETFTYNKVGNLTTHVDRKAQTFSFSYDDVSRLTKKEFPSLPGTLGNTLVTFSYDANNNGNLTDDNDNLAKVVSPDASLTFTYDAFDRIATAATTGSPNQPDVTTSYTYDKNGNRTVLTAKQGATTVASLNYTSDKLNRLQSLVNTLTSQTMSFTYDALSRRKQLDLPNSTRTTTTYNAASEVDTITHTYVPTNTVISKFIYSPDSIGNRDALTETRPSFSITNGLNDFGYDLLNRLTTATHPTIPIETYTYDPVGNRNPSTWVYDAANRLLNDGTFTYTYDANGNRINQAPPSGPGGLKKRPIGLTVVGGQTTYAYTPENQLTQVELPNGSIATYTYDGLGRRIEKTVNGISTRYIYDQEDILLEYDGNNVLKARYTHGPGIDEPLVMERDTDNDGTFESTERFSYHADGLGSITELTDSTGAVVRSYLYDSFGNIVQQTGSLTNPYTYTAREFDSESGLFYYRARYYDPRTGRFLQEEMVPQSPRRKEVFGPNGLIKNFDAGILNILKKRPIRLHSYLYTLDNPVNFVDNSGKSPLSPNGGVINQAWMNYVSILSVIPPLGPVPLPPPTFPFMPIRPPNDFCPPDQPSPDEQNEKEKKDCAQICKHLEDDPERWWECINAWTSLVLP